MREDNMMYFRGVTRNNKTNHTISCNKMNENKEDFW